MSQTSFYRGLYNFLLLTNSFDWFYPPVMIMSEHLALKFQSYILILNSVTNLSKLSITESRDAGWEPPALL